MSNYNPRVVSPLPTGDPLLIRRDVWIAMCEAAVLHHHPHMVDTLRLADTAPVYVEPCGGVARTSTFDKQYEICACGDFKALCSKNCRLIV